MGNAHLSISEEIQNKIYTIRGLQVMIDSDLARLYCVETRRLNEQVKRNADRFPKEFMFQLTKEEADNLMSQIAISSSRHGGRRKLPYAFTEQGVAMLSSVLHSDTAIQISIRIMEAFVSMRRFMLTNAQIFQRLGTLEVKQDQTDLKIDDVLTAIENKSIQPKQGIFFDGQVFDAWKFVSDLVRSARKSIVLIDNYVDDTVLTLFAKRNMGVSVTILTKTISKQLEQDVKKFNKQYPFVTLNVFTVSHDRFLIIDDNDVYHFGASLKDVGKKWFAFSKMDIGAVDMLENLKNNE